nr:S-formylglutathione hydrolase [Oceanococcus sp. HetDA_MAG_MS8]
MELIANNRCFGGEQRRYRHNSAVLNCEMTFSVYLPPKVLRGEKAAVVYWLSGLTCTDENFVQKAGAQRYAAELGLILVAPDTSPRGDEVADDAEGAYDLGLGAGFYVNATQSPWTTHYRMYDYILQELPEVVAEVTPHASDRASICGHSMGGHGALVVALRNEQRFCSVSAFAPISSPTRCPWGQKALQAYLGDDQTTWADYDASLLLEREGTSLPMLVDQGTADDFLQEQLCPDYLQDAAQTARSSLQLRMQEGYDHSYFFISSFIGEHLSFHAKHLYKENDEA